MKIFSSPTILLKAGMKMNKNVGAVPCVVLTFSPDQLQLVKETLAADGYEENELKQWILDNMAEDETPESKYAGSADRVIENVAAFVRDNPTTIHAAGTIAGNIINRVIKKPPPFKRGPV